ncbi:MAG: YCF48-related protein [Fluviicola sp.]
MKTNYFYYLVLCSLMAFFTPKNSFSQDWGALNSGINDNINDVWFADENTGLVVANAGRILGTIDGGSNWNLIPSGTVENLNSVDSPSMGVLVACGDNGVILRSTNSGLTWTAITSGVSESLSAVTFFDANNGMITGTLGTILTTTDAGLNWTSQTSTTTNALNGNAYTPSGNMYAVGDGLTNPTILVSFNSGSNWTAQSSTSLNNLSDVAFVNDNNGFAIGDLGSLLTTTDGGANWALSAISSENLNSIVFVNDSVGFISGGNGSILKTEDYGATWNALTSNSVQAINSISMLSELSGYAVGTNGEILKTCPTPEFTSSMTDSICEGVTVDFTNASSAADSYLWLVDGDTVATTENYSHTFTTTGNIDVVLIAINAACENQLSEAFTVSSAPVVDLGNDTTICSSCSDTLYAPTGPGLTYEWYYNGTFNGNISDVNIASSPGEYVVLVTNSEGCVGSDTVNVMMTSGLIEQGTTSDLNITVYPNPSSGVFNIALYDEVEDLEYRITNALGVQVSKGILNKVDTKIDLTDRAVGIYYLTVMNDKVSKTIILQKD